jgi:ketosteroid isomerase-like protein
MEHVEEAISNLELAKEAYKLFAEGNIPSFMEMQHDDVVYEIIGEPDVPYAGTYKGKDELMRFFGKLNEILEFKKFKPKEFITEGDNMAVVVDSEATIRSNGNTAQRDLVHLLNFKDGKCIRLRDFSDTNLLVKALM